MKTKQDLLIDLAGLFHGLGVDARYYINQLYLRCKKNNKRKSDVNIIYDCVTLIDYNFKDLSFLRVKDYGYYIRDNDTATNYYLFQ